MYSKAKRLILILSFLLIASSAFSALQFNVKDYYGNTVTSDIFKDYDVTMVNIFATWCGPCLIEMPEINELYPDRPEGSNIIAICSDAYDAPMDLDAIMKHYKLQFPILKMTNRQVFNIYDKLTAFPTTLFIDREGNILDVMVGVPRSGAYKGYMAKLKELLEASK